MSATLQRRIIGAIVALVVVVTCFFLGRWQWNRHQDRSAAVEQVLTAYEQQPVPLTDLVPQTDSLVPTSLVWRPVELQGSFEEPAILIRNRPVDGKHGFHIAQPFKIDGEDMVVVVNRGFVTAEREGDVPKPADTGEHVSLIGHLRKAEAPDAREAPTGQGFTFNPDQLLPQTSHLVSGAYVITDTQSPAAASEIVPLPPPETDLGSHFSYALQWWFFAGGSIVAFFLLIRREDAHEAASGRDTNKPARPRRTKSRDEHEEDALIEAWEARQ